MRILPFVSLFILGGAVSAVELKPAVEYQVVTMNGKSLDQVEGLKVPTLLLDAQEKRVSGTSGINRYGGGYAYSDGVLTIGQPFSTMMAGPEAAMKVEQEFLMIITGPIKITPDPKGVLLTGVKGNLVIAETKAK